MAVVKKKNRKKYLVLLGVTLIIMLTLLAVISCEPVHKIKIENGSEQVLVIYYDVGRTGYLVSLGNVEPNEHIFTPNFWLNDGYYQINAENEHGEVIFSREYDWWELRDMDWTVVITPPEED
jgi:hypothetical protein